MQMNKQAVALGAFIWVGLAVLAMQLFTLPVKQDVVNQEEIATTETVRIIQLDSKEIEKVVQQVEPAPDILEKVNKPNSSEGSADGENANIAYIVQFGAFSAKERALVLREKLNDSQYPAYIVVRKKADSAKMLYQLRLGPYSKRENAVHVAGEIERRLKLTSFILKIENGDI